MKSFEMDDFSLVQYQMEKFQENEFQIRCNLTNFTVSYYFSEVKVQGP